jgi:serine protein kinase
MQRVPIYVLSANGERSPVNDHPLCLFNRRKMRRSFRKSMASLPAISAPLCRRGRKRLHEFGGDITKFRVVKVWPSILEQVAIAKTER